MGRELEVRSKRMFVIEEVCQSKRRRGGTRDSKRRKKLGTWGVLCKAQYRIK